jgi:DNA-binding CsgD family transcriptional regulator
VGTYAQERAPDRIAELAGRGYDLVTFWQSATEVLDAALDYYDAPCWFTLDPASLLVTSHYNPSMPVLPEDWMRHEYLEDEVHNLTTVVRSRRGWSTLHDATGGDPSGTWRWNANMEYGGDQELIVGLTTRAGDAWGALTLYREPGEPLFNHDEIALVRSLSQWLAEGARRALLVGEALDPQGSEAPGVIVLADDGTIESATPTAARLIDDLPGGDWDAGRVPPAVHAVAARAAAHPDAQEAAVARVLSESGRWMVLHGTALEADGLRRAAAIIEPGHPARISALLMSAYGLTNREQDVTRLVLQGNSTAEISNELTVSPHTVQQHLKSIFEKTGVRSRRDLVGKVFFAHYEPRLRDNEQRALDGRPFRGGPDQK